MANDQQAKPDNGNGINQVTSMWTYVAWLTKKYGLASAILVIVGAMFLEQWSANTTQKDLANEQITQIKDDNQSRKKILEQLLEDRKTEAGVKERMAVAFERLGGSFEKIVGMESQSIERDTKLEISISAANALMDQNYKILKSRDEIFKKQQDALDLQQKATDSIKDVLDRTCKVMFPLVDERKKQTELLQQLVDGQKRAEMKQEKAKP